jgi:hypothetical protein
MQTAEQIEVLRSLSQGSIAWLFQVTPRSVRDWPTLPRNKDGTYDARAVLEWAIKRELYGSIPDDARCE